MVFIATCNWQLQVYKWRDLSDHFLGFITYKPPPLHVAACLGYIDTRLSGIDIFTVLQE